MNSRHYKVVFLATILAIFLLACGSGPTADDVKSIRVEKNQIADEIDNLKDQKVALEASISDLDDEISENTNQINKLENALENPDKTPDEIIALQDEIAEKKSTRDELQLTAEERESEASSALQNKNEAEDAIDRWKNGSRDYRVFIEEQTKIYNITECADSVASSLALFGITDSASQRKIKAEVKGPISGTLRLSESELRAEASLLGKTRPNNSCPRWEWGDDTPFITHRQLVSKVCKNEGFNILNRQPTKFDGQCVTGWGEVVQFDAATGPCAFHMNIDEDKQWRTYNYDYRVEMVSQSRTNTSCSWLDRLEEGDNVAFIAIGNGRLDYTTASGGSMSIPSLKIIQWGGQGF